MKFKTTIFQKGNNLGIEIPENIIAKLNAGKKPPVLMTIKGYTFRSTVAVMGGKFLIPLSSEHRKFVTVKGGDQLEMNIELDPQPRDVEIPTILALALKDNTNAKTFFETLAPSGKRKIITLIKTAKKDETTDKRLDKVISDLNQHIKP
jgi:hypothetical protein